MTKRFTTPVLALRDAVCIARSIAPPPHPRRWSWNLPPLMLITAAVRDTCGAPAMRTPSAAPVHGVGVVDLVFAFREHAPAR